MECFIGHGSYTDPFSTQKNTFGGDKSMLKVFSGDRLFAAISGVADSFSGEKRKWPPKFH